jgi:threonine aldolase
MRTAMMAAHVGDDVFAEDTEVNALQAKAAALFGMEAALFCPSGTMTNQIAIKLHTQPGDEVICDRLSHIYLYEGGGIAMNSGASVRLLAGDRGRFSADQVADNINNANDAHFPVSRLVSIENTVNKGGGATWDLEDIRQIRALTKQRGLALHLDGARLFNALVARKQTPLMIGALFDTISICLSKGLGAPVGSLLLGTRDHIYRAHRIRKVLGGGMRQAGFLAAAGQYALDHHIDRLTQDHEKATALEQALRSLSYVVDILPVETNIVIFQLDEKISTDSLLNYLNEHHVRASSVGKQLIRMVFHLDISDSQFDRLLSILRAFH